MHRNGTLLSTTCLTAVLLCALPQAAYANPLDGKVNAGKATIDASGKKLDIYQKTNKVVIDWRGFDIAPGEKTQFHQPGQNSVALNRVTSTSASRIDGNLTANGNVVIVNQNGILFGQNAKVDVNGLVATTADIDNRAFMKNDKLVFDKPGNPDAAIINEGQITAREAGLVGMVAPNVINSGTITAKLGRVHLASGDTATVDLYGDGLMKVAVSDEVTSQLVGNSGAIEADGGTIALTAAAGKEIVNSLVIASGSLQAQSVGEQNGEIIIEAAGSNAVAGNNPARKGEKQGDSSVMVSGILDVSGRRRGERGGKLTITGDNVALGNGTRIDASGHSGKSGTTAGREKSALRPGSAGGDIRIGGDYLGKGKTPTAKNLYVDPGVLVLNDATHSGDAGRTIFWSDETTRFYGNVYARALGGKAIDPQSWNATKGGSKGDGGFVETSGHGQLDAGGYVDLTASNGTRGTYFLDPTNITIYGNFTPKDVAGLKLWLDGNDIDGDGVAEGLSETGVVNGAGNCGAAVSCVSTWTDKALGNNATQGTVGNRPVVTTSTQNGKTYVTFNGDASAHFINGTIGATSDNTSIFTAANFLETSPTDYDYVINVGNGVGGQNFSIARSWNANGGATAKGLYSYDGNNARGAQTVAGGTWDLIGGRTNPTGDRYTFTLNGSETSAPGHAGIASTNGVYSIGRYNPGSSHNLDGYVGEVLIYDQAITTTQKQLIEQYQSAKWGVRLTPPGAGAVTTDLQEATQAMTHNAAAPGDAATNGYSSFTTRYLERLSQSADVSLQASNDITFDLRGDTMTLAADRNLILTAGHDIKTTISSPGTIVTSRSAAGGNITMTAGNDIDLSNISLKSGNGDINLTATGNATLSSINSGTGNVTVAGYDVFINNNTQPASLIAYYNFEEGAGTTATDASGTGNTGTLMGGTSYSATVPTGLVSSNYSLNFDGSSGYVSIADSNSLDLTTGFTFSLWVKSTGAQSNRYLLSKRNNAGSDNVYSLLYGYSANQVQYYTSGSAYGYPGTNSNIDIGDSNWHQVTYTYNGSNFSAYKDSVLINSTNVTANPAVSTSNLLLGTFNGAGYYFSGLMDDVRIYNTALSGADISALYNSSTTWQSGTATINAAHNISLDLKGDTLTAASNRNINLNAVNNIVTVSKGGIASAGTGTITLAAGNDVNLTQDVDLNARGSGSVTVQANNSILYSGSGDISTQGGVITLNSDRDGSLAGAISLGTGTQLTSNNGAITLGGGTTPTTGFAYGTSANANGIYLDGAQIASGTGHVTLSGQGYTAGSAANSHGIWMNNSAQITTTDGNIALNGKGGSGTAGGDSGWGNIGVYMTGSAAIASSTGDIDLEGLSGTGNVAWNTGVAVYTNATIITAGDGNITIEGTNNSTLGGDQLGIWYGNSATKIQTQDGDILLTGTSTRVNSTSHGVYLYNNSNGIKSTGDGDITLTGISSSSSTGVRFDSGANLFSSGTGDINILSDSYSIIANPTLQTTGTVTFAPTSSSRAIDVAGGTGNLGITAGLLNNVTAGSIVIGRSDNTSATTLNTYSWNAPVSILSGTGAINIDGVQTMGARSFTARTYGAGNITFGASGGITSSAAGNAITLASGGNFTNSAGSGALSASSGRWRVYSQSPLLDTTGSLAYSFRRYSCTYAGGCAVGVDVPVSGNGFFYASTPLLTATASTKNITYGDTVSLTNYLYGLTGYIGGDATDDIITGTLNGSTDYAQGNNVGSYHIDHDSGSLSSKLGYGFTLADSSTALVVGQRSLAISADAKTKVYGAADPALTYQLTSGSLYTGDTFSGALTRAAGETVAGGPYAITRNTLTAGSNYNITYTGANLSITPYLLSVAADTKTKVYGAADPALTYTYGALQNGDTAAVFSGALSRAVGETVAGGPYAIGQNTLSAGSNYTVSYSGANLSITPKTLTAGLTGTVSKTYDRSTTATLSGGNYQLTGIINSDDVALNNPVSGTYDTVDVDTGKTVSVNGLALTGTTASNYQLAANSVSGAVGTIVAKALAIIADAKTKFYGAADPALTYSQTGLESGDSITGSLSRAAGENAGLYAIGQGTLASSNYAITYTSAGLTISPASLSVAAINANKAFGAADPALAYSYTGLVGGDTSAVFTGAIARAAGESSGDYAIGRNDLAATGNYTIGTFTDGIFTIAAAPPAPPVTPPPVTPPPVTPPPVIPPITPPPVTPPEPGPLPDTGTIPDTVIHVSQDPILDNANVDEWLAGEFSHIQPRPFLTIHESPLSDSLFVFQSDDSAPAGSSQESDSSGPDDNANSNTGPDSDSDVKESQKGLLTIDSVLAKQLALSQE